MYIKKVLKHGNSLAVVIPVEVCRALEIRRADFVKIMVGSDDTLFIKRVDYNEAKQMLDNGSICKNTKL